MTPSDTRKPSQESPEPRLLILDEDISHKLARELGNRERVASAVYLKRVNGCKDGALFKALREFEPFVLVTWDNRMPFSHREALEHHGTTVTVLDRRGFYASPRHTSEARYIADVVHRWAHLIETQPPQTVRRLTDRRSYRPMAPQTYVEKTPLPPG